MNNYEFEGNKFLPLSRIPDRVSSETVHKNNNYFCLANLLKKGNTISVKIYYVCLNFNRYLFSKQKNIVLKIQQFSLTMF